MVVHVQYTNIWGPVYDKRDTYDHKVHYPKKSDERHGARHCTLCVQDMRICNRQVMQNVCVHEVQQFLSAYHQPFNREVVAPEDHPFTCTTRHAYLSVKFLAYVGRSLKG